MRIKIHHKGYFSHFAGVESRVVHEWIMKKTCSPSKAKVYYLPTYGIDYRSQERDEMISSKLFRPVQFQRDTNTEEADCSTQIQRSDMIASKLFRPIQFQIKTDSSCQVSQGSKSDKLFRPVEFQESTESDDEECSRRNSYTSIDSAYSSQPETMTSYQPQKKIKAALHNKNLWKSFMAIGNEMIVTKPGRLVS